MNTFFLKTASIIGALSVALGAFGAHALKPMLMASNRLETYETAIKYMFYHALALLLVGVINKDFSGKWLQYSGNSFILGTLIFSGSLLVLCFSGIKILGAIAPIGGTLLILGWVFLFLALSKA
jgi:uncharacterized membrane protein YgdD (TMEM256/DUF423 family)